MTGSSPHAVIVDTSAAVAVILGERGSDELTACMETAMARLMPTATKVELGIVIEARLGPAGADIVTRFLRDAEVELVDVDTDAAERALGAWRRFGKGRHRAALNFGDCFVFALAERTGCPVVCTGEDFAATGVDVLHPAGQETAAPEDDLDG